MRTPRKLYILVSRKSRAEPSLLRGYLKKADALKSAARRNASHHWKTDDWRVETFVKGD